MKPRHLNINQLKTAAGISRATAYRWVKRGILPPPKKQAGAALWDAKTVRESLARRARLLLA